MFDIIIVGAGTAGLSAAIYGLRAGKSVLVLDDVWRSDYQHAGDRKLSGDSEDFRI